MDNYERHNRIEEALNIRGMKAVELVERTGLSKSSVSHWIKQRWQPKQKAIMTMASVLEVSEMWLAGYDVPMERPAERIKMDKLAQSINAIRKNERLTDLMINITKLNETQLSTVESMVNELVKLSQPNP